MRYITSAEAKREFHIVASTLKIWKDTGRIKYKKLSSKKFLYDADSVENQEESSGFNYKNVIYARVSTSGQRKDLDNQIDIIKSFMLSNGVKPDLVLKDIASGMNTSRKSFNELLEMVFKREVKCVYITFKDRLTRFGFDYFKQIFEYFDTRIVILDETNETPKTYQQEMCDDLISIIHTYSMKLYNDRGKKLKQIENIILDDNIENEDK